MLKNLSAHCWRSTRFFSEFAFKGICTTFLYFIPICLKTPRTSVSVTVTPIWSQIPDTTECALSMKWSMSLILVIYSIIYLSLAIFRPRASNISVRNLGFLRPFATSIEMHYGLVLNSLAISLFYCFSITTWYMMLNFYSKVSCPLLHPFFLCPWGISSKIPSS